MTEDERIALNVTHAILGCQWDVMGIIDQIRICLVCRKMQCRHRKVTWGGKWIATEWGDPDEEDIKYWNIGNDLKR